MYRLALFLILAGLLRHTAAAAQAVNGAAFMRDFQLAADDANVGFTQLKGAEVQRLTLYGIIYEANLRMLGAGNSQIYYNDETYLKFTKVTVPRTFYFSQSFDNTTAAGRFAADSAQALLDAYATRYHLVKRPRKPERRKKGEPQAPPTIDYLTPDRQLLYTLSLNPASAKQETGITVCSSRANASAGNYLGCMLLYDMPDDKTVRYLAVYYVYGDALPNPGELSGKLIAQQQNTSSYRFKRYEWKPGTTYKQMVLYLDPLGVRYESHAINADGSPKR